MEDDLIELLEGIGEVTSARLGISGGNINIEFFGEEEVLQDIKSYLLSYGFDTETVLDVDGKRMFLGS